MPEKTQAELDWEALQIVLARAVEANPRYPDAVRAAAIPHWFDAEILAALLGDDADAPALLTWLTQRPFVERYGERAYALHERTRDMLRSRLWADDRERFRDWSARVGEFYRKQLGEKAEPAELKGPHEAKLTAEEESLYAEIVYHRLIVDDAGGLLLFQQAFLDAESTWKVTVCHLLVAGLREQMSLTGNYAPWLRHYEGRLLDQAQSWDEAAKAQREVLTQNVETKLRMWALAYLGIASISLGEFQAAVTSFEEALSLCREQSDLSDKGKILGYLGSAYLVQGLGQKALAHFEASLRLRRELGDRVGEAGVVDSISQLYLLQGRWEEALTLSEANLELWRELGYRERQGMTRSRIGNIYLAQGKQTAAQTELNEAIKLLRSIESPEADKAADNAIVLLGFSRFRLSGCLSLLIRVNPLFEKLFGRATRRWLFQARAGRKGARAGEAYKKMIEMMREIGQGKK